MIVVPTLHPAFLGRAGDEQAGAAKFGDAVQSDIAKALRLTRERPRWDASQIWEKDSVGRPWRMFPNVEEVESFVRYAAANAQCGGVLVCDVETSGDHAMACRLLCVGLGTIDPTGRVSELFCVPFLAQGGSEYWSDYDRARVVHALGWLLSWAPTGFHNGPFDTLVLAGHGLPVGNYCHDSMQAHHVADGEMPAGLYYLASRKTDGRYWKDDVKGAERWVEKDATTLRSYNLLDVKATGESLVAVEQDVARLGAWDLYQDELALCRYFTRATARGIAVDQSRRLALAQQLRAQRDAGLALMRSVAGIHGQFFDPMKPTHLRYYLYELLKFPIVQTSEKSGLPSTDKNALVLLALMADTKEKVAALKGLVDFRTAEKMLGTWVENLPTLSDGRIHPGWKLLPVSGRFASSPNVQNLPPIIKKLFTAARPGTADPTDWRFVGVDLSQAELRYIGYDADDPFLLEMYARGINVHTVNCALFFNVRPPPGHDDMDPQTEAYIREILPNLLPGTNFDAFPEMTKAQWKPTRTLAKNAEFGTNYIASDETVYAVLRSKRDPSTNELLFPQIELSEVSAVIATKKRIRPALIEWQQRVPLEAQATGYTRCAISGRYRFYRAGFKGTEVTNTRIQSGVASHMNKRTLEIAGTFDRETGGAAQITVQVHDALTVECPAEYAKRAGEVMVETLSRPFALPHYPNARLPADKADIGQHLNEV